MTIQVFGIAALIMPIVFATGVWWAVRRGSKWAWPLVILTVLALVLALVTLFTVGGHVESTSIWQ